MPGKPRKRSLTITGHVTSISLEDAFWEALKEVAVEHGRTPAAIVADIDRSRQDAGLSTAVRVYLLQHFRAKAR